MFAAHSRHVLLINASVIHAMLASQVVTIAIMRLQVVRFVTILPILGMVQNVFQSVQMDTMEIQLIGYVPFAIQLVGHVVDLGM